jgi:hypothetical protein
MIFFLSLEFFFVSIGNQMENIEGVVVDRVSSYLKNKPKESKGNY